MSNPRLVPRLPAAFAGLAITSLTFLFAGCDGASSSAPAAKPAGESNADKAKVSAKGAMPIKDNDFSEGIPRKQ